MKKHIKKAVVCLMMMMIAAVSAAQSAAKESAAAAAPTMLVFSTKGPDCYADGTAVQVGECYALVWARDGHEFAGVDMNGEVVDCTNNAIVVAMSLAKARRNGAVRCPATVFQLPADMAKDYAGGTFSLILLDTRKSNGAGGLVATGNPGHVNGWGLAAKSRIRAVSGGDDSAGEDRPADSTTTTHASALPAGEEIPQPRITGIKVENGFVVLTVKGTHPRLIYNIASGSTPSRINRRRSATRGVPGHANGVDREITVIAPVQEGQNFFKIIRN